MLESNALFSNANPWGFVPGEAACAALIRPGGAGIPPVVQVSGFSDAMEPVPERLNQDSTYIGLTEAAIAALEAHARLGLAPPAHAFTDWNNSRYRASEFSYTLLRLAGLIQPGMDEAQHPTHRFGQCGAAGFTAAISALPSDPKFASLILCGNEADGIRGAFVLRRSKLGDIRGLIKTDT